MNLRKNLDTTGLNRRLLFVMNFSSLFLMSFQQLAVEGIPVIKGRNRDKEIVAYIPDLVLHIFFFMTA